MANTRLRVSFGPGFSQTRTLTWKKDGLIVLPTGNPRLPTVRVSSYAQDWCGHDFIGGVPHHLLWFTVYCNDNTSFLGRWGDSPVHKFRVGRLIYTVGRSSQVLDKNAFQRYYIEMLAIGRAGD